MAQETVRFPLTDERDIRRTAQLRTWFCPGAGYALVGRKLLATVLYCAAFVTIPALLLWLAFAPSPLAVLCSLVLIALGCVGLVVEHVGCRRIVLRSSGPAFLVRGFPVAVGLLGLVIIGAVVILRLELRTVILGGGGMSPTVEKGDMLLYSTRVEPTQLRRGKAIFFKLSEDCAWKQGDPNDVTIGRILALPGDEIAIRMIDNESQYVVNGTLSTPVPYPGRQALAFNVPQEPATLLVPHACYFIIPDDTKHGYDSRVLSWVRESNIAGTKLFYLTPAKFLQPLE